MRSRAKGWQKTDASAQKISPISLKKDPSPRKDSSPKGVAASKDSGALQDLVERKSLVADVILKKKSKSLSPNTKGECDARESPGQNPRRRSCEPIGLGMAWYPNLQCLDLRFNSIIDLDDLGNLCADHNIISRRHLKSLYLYGNPLCDTLATNTEWNPGYQNFLFERYFYMNSCNEVYSVMHNI